MKGVLTENHLVFTNNGWQKIKDVILNDKVMTPAGFKSIKFLSSAPTPKGIIRKIITETSIRGEV